MQFLCQLRTSKIGLPAGLIPTYHHSCKKQPNAYFIQVLPSLLTIDPRLETMPSTIYFVLRSTSVPILSVGQFLLQSDAEYVHAPPKLVESANIHLEVLKSPEASGKRYEHPLILEFQRLLSSCLTGLAFGVSGKLNLCCQTLSPYRWTSRGTGIISMKEDDAEREWDYPGNPSDELWDASHYADGGSIYIIPL